MYGWFFLLVPSPKQIVCFLTVWPLKLHPYCSAKISLTKVINDHQVIKSNRHFSVIVFDFSAAFDTDNHSFFFGVHYILALYETTVSWVLFFLPIFSVFFEDLASCTWLLSIEVHHDTILDTLTISLYTLYLRDLIYFHGLKYHLYATVSKMYILYTWN